MTVGSDSYTNEILRTALQHFSQTPKQWEHFIFYPIPMTSSRYNTNKDTSTGFVVNFAGKHSNALCDYIASKNQRYNEIFSATTVSIILIVLIVRTHTIGLNTWIL
jgi:hypothetical protein